MSVQTLVDYLFLWSTDFPENRILDRDHVYLNKSVRKTKVKLKVSSLSFWFVRSAMPCDKHVS